MAFVCTSKFLLFILLPRTEVVVFMNFFQKAVKKKGSYPLRPGVQGFFITCDGGREHQASREALNILDSV